MGNNVKSVAIRYVAMVSVIAYTRTVSACPVSACPVSACPVSACPVSACLVSACPVSACPVSACPASACPVSACPVSACPVSACPVSACPVSACPVSACPVSACPVSACPVSACPANACPASACPVSACPANACPTNACPANACPANACPVSACPRNLLQSPTILFTDMGQRYFEQQDAYGRMVIKQSLNRTHMEVITPDVSEELVEKDEPSTECTIYEIIAARYGVGSLKRVECALERKPSQEACPQGSAKVTDYVPENEGCGYLPKGVSNIPEYCDGGYADPFKHCCIKWRRNGCFGTFSSFAEFARDGLIKSAARNLISGNLFSIMS